jgi:hypothetical protein
MKKQIDLSLVVCVADDLRIITMLETIDVNCEVVVVLNGATKRVKKMLRDFKETSLLKINVIELPERNLSKARCYGIEKIMFS